MRARSGGWTQRGVGLEALEGSLPSLRVTVAVVAFCHPGFPGGVELIEGQELFAVTRRAFELLFELARSHTPRPSEVSALE